ncbi:D-alanyl-D-alanine carboxypeptidase family protein [Falsibacillus pallidus]|uniref:D-alanyl-D-alanine carboxypeptidase (Penicillin-binding protein 5/6) n=1 Tax=Falsibacillus pallidus TaxID=493781 RepID=A0A370GFI2_9BACI|nr:D-alanyl-D-alanine carboxypeptidase family protein [Falsibacillus pallidus]RDI41869.1 D-alanyl-D-alanine carboxypeptidase (penicillin-binding protein 5/6) [Falsibacillus pallidus]
MKLYKWMIVGVLAVVLAGSFYAIKSGTEDKGKSKSHTAAVSSHKKPKEEAKKKITLPNMGIQGKSVLLLNAKDGSILYEKNIHESLPPASISKMMTELLVLRAIKKGEIQWDQSIKISDYAYAISSHPGFASIHLEKGKPYTVRELYEGMAIRSANEAAIALAETVSGSEKNFVAEMNKTAQQLGLTETHFVDSTGLSNLDLGDYYTTGGPNDTNVMSANDIGLLAMELLKEFPEILDVMKQSSVTFGDHRYTNTNWMLPKINKHDLGYAGVDGLKTGFTDEAGYCFAGTVKKDGTRLISVILGAPSKAARYTETKRLYDAAYNLIGK